MQKATKAPKAKLPGRFYPADDVKKATSTTPAPKPTKLRPSITPGTVLILLAGRFKGKRVVFLKQLDSGLLLVSGPFKVNGVPARRVNQAYVIATSTKVAVPADLKLDKFTDTFFKKAEKSKKSGEMFEQAAAPALTQEYLTAQKEVDAALTKAISPEVTAYLSARFSLQDGDRPHLMKF